MSSLIAPPVFALVGEFFTIVVVMISVITWIIRAIQGTNQQLPPPVQRPGRRREGRDDEIDSFLEQVNRPQNQNRTAESRNQVPATRSRTTPPLGPTPAKPRQQARPLAETLNSGTRTPDANRRPNSNTLSSSSPVGSQGMGSQEIGQGLQQHVKDYMGERMGREAQKDLGPTLAQKTQAAADGERSGQGSSPTNNRSNLRSEVSPPAAVGPSATAAQTVAAALSTGTPQRTENLRQLLRSPQMISQAIIVQEVLRRPKSLRK